MGKIAVITKDPLPGKTVRKYHMSGEHKVLLKGYEYRGKSYPEPVDDNLRVAKVFCYHAEVTGRKERRLSGGKKFLVEEKTAYWYEEGNRRFLFLLLFFLLLAPPVTAVSISMINRQEEGQTVIDRIRDVIGEEKAEQREEEIPNIIYQGFTDEFVIDAGTQYLSIQNSEENEERYYTGVQLWEGDAVIYDMGNTVIEPGKYVNINLYELLEAGKHEIMILQYGFYIDSQAPISSVSQQEVTVEVIK